MGRSSFALLGAAIVVTSTFAAPEASATAAEARSCPKLFGSDARVRANAHRRVREITSLERTRAGREVLIHQVGRWREPKPTRLAGVVLEGITDDGDGRAAIVRLQGELATLCGEGPFRVRADDAIGARVRVLGVMPHGLLLEQDEKLRTLSAAASSRVGVELVFSSSFMLVPGDSSSTVSTTAARSTSARNELSPATKVGSTTGLKAAASANKASALSRRQKAAARKTAGGKR
jgi:hypothetical protein